MCFSATASFAAGAVLVPAGVYCMTAALRKSPRRILLAAVPLAFGIQQISEGFVWHGIEHDDPEVVRQGSLVFLFFALAFWPFWFCFMSAMTDPRPVARSLFIMLAIASSAWFWLYMFPLLTGPASLLKTVKVYHSINYDFNELPINQMGLRTLLRTLYFMCVILPFVFGAEKIGLIPGLILGVMVIVAVVVYNHAFVSVWCFLAAWLSPYLCWFFWKLKPDGVAD